MKSFIDVQRIENILERNKGASESRIKEIIKKARLLKGLDLEDTAALLGSKDKELAEEVFRAARFVKESIYGTRLVLFAPLYLSNICSNNCVYCSFRADNKDMPRKSLTMDEIKRNVEILEREGHKRLLLVAAEDPKASTIEYLKKAIDAVYSTKVENGSIRRVNVNIAPLSLEEFRELKKTGIGTYQLFQETYHPGMYRLVHPAGPKKDYENRLFAMDKAQEAGIDDVGIGVLFGLYDHKFEVLALLEHSNYLDKKFGVGPHTISVPRLKPAYGAPLTGKEPYPVSDEEFKSIVAILRLAVPYTGMILSTRESASFRDEVIALGISQISAGSRTDPGGYETERKGEKGGQFELEDTRPQLVVIKEMLKNGFFPSFCTACYRLRRTGKDFMDLAKPGDIKNFCLPNCLLTFKEYALDYGDAELKEKAEKIIDLEIGKITNPSVKAKTKEKLKLLATGRRDLYF